jgi:hypothetical protein
VTFDERIGRRLGGLFTGRAVGAALVVVSAALVSSTSVPAGVRGWHVIGRAASSGDFASAAANGTAKKPHRLAVKIAGSGVSGFAAVACTKGIASIGSKTTNYSGAGIHMLRLPFARASSCEVTASVAGSGRISIQILST